MCLLQGKVKKTNWGAADAPAGEIVATPPTAPTKTDKAQQQSDITVVVSSRSPNALANGKTNGLAPARGKDVDSVCDQGLMNGESLAMTESTDATVRVNA